MRVTTRTTKVIFQLAKAPDYRFPDVEYAGPEGLLAVGGDLNSERLLAAYRQGIFPWYSDDQPILWWSPDPRAVLLPDNLKISRSLRKTIRKNIFRVTLDQDFAGVVRACASPRRGDSGTGTWITPEMMDAYTKLYQLGYAHSVEVWHDNKLVGGLYGVSLGKAFFGESMFNRMTDASKVGFSFLVRQLEKWGYDFIDCQVESEHLASLGAQPIPRKQFVEMLDDALRHEDRPAHWTADVETIL